MVSIWGAPHGEGGNDSGAVRAVSETRRAHPPRSEFCREEGAEGEAKEEAVEEGGACASGAEGGSAWWVATPSHVLCVGLRRASSVQVVGLLSRMRAPHASQDVRVDIPPAEWFLVAGSRRVSPQVGVGLPSVRAGCCCCQKKRTEVHCWEVFQICNVPGHALVWLPLQIPSGTASEFSSAPARSGTAAARSRLSRRRHRA